MPTIKWSPTQTTTTIASASNGAVLPQATINVNSTTGFPASGSVEIQLGSTTTRVSYTGTTATSFTGCSGGAGTLATYEVVRQPYPEVAEVNLGERMLTVAPLEAKYIEDADLSTVQSKLTAISGSVAVLPW